jgi:hypothetical protein
MHYLFPRVAVAILTCVVGLTAHSATNRLVDYLWPDVEISTRLVGPIGHKEKNSQEYAGQSSSKKLIIRSFKNPPVEIVSIKLNGRTLKSNDSFSPSSDWTSNLEVTVKNVSEQIVTGVEVSLYAEKVDAADVATFNTDLTFGAPRSFTPVFLPPDGMAVLSHTFTHGDIFDFDYASIVVQRVYTKNDNTFIWSAGRMLRRSPDGHSYYPE